MSYTMKYLDHYALVTFIYSHLFFSTTRLVEILNYYIELLDKLNIKIFNFRFMLV